MSFSHPLLQLQDSRPPPQILPSPRWGQIHKQALWVPRGITLSPVSPSGLLRGVLVQQHPLPSTPPAPLVAQRVSARFPPEARTLMPRALLLADGTAPGRALSTVLASNHTQHGSCGRWCRQWGRAASHARSRWSRQPVWTRPLSCSVLWPSG